MNENLSSEAERIIKKRPYTKQAINSYLEIRNVINETQPLKIKYQFNEEIENIKRIEGFPLFSVSNLPFELKEAYPIMNRIIEKLIKKKREDTDAIEKLKKILKKDPSSIDQLFHSVLNKSNSETKSISAKLSLSPKVLEFIVIMSIKPLLHRLRDSIASMLKDWKWNKGYCPICGSEPNMAYLDDKGKRHLHCSMCDHEWNWARIRCPFCNNQEHTNMGYLYAEEEEGIRIDFCRKCKRYIKTIDKRVYKDPCSMELEHIATLHLDILAQKEGFK